jgi:type IV pilus assembly protein PilO
VNLEAELGKLTISKAILVGVIMAGLYYLMMYDSGDKINQNIKNVNVSISKQKDEITAIEKAIQVVEEFSKKVALLGDKFEKLIKYIPENFTAIDQMKLVSKQAKSAGTNIQRISQGTEGKKLNFYEELNVNVELSGTYTQIVLFLSFLTKLDKVLVMKEMSMTAAGSTKSGEARKVQFSGRVTGYRYIDEDKIDKSKRRGRR